MISITTIIAINLVVGIINILVSFGLIYWARISIRTSRLNIETSKRLSERIGLQ